MIFLAGDYELFFDVNGGGGTLSGYASSVGSMSQGGTYVPDNNEFFEITASPNSNYTVKRWMVNGGDIGSTSTTYSGYMDQPYEIFVEFELDVPAEFPVVFNMIGYGPSGGSLSATSSTEGNLYSGQAVFQGSQVDFVFTPGGNFEVVDWEVNGMSQGVGGNTYTIYSLVQNTTVEAVIAEKGGYDMNELIILRLLEALDRKIDDRGVENLVNGNGISIVNSSGTTTVSAKVNAAQNLINNAGASTDSIGFASGYQLMTSAESTKLGTLPTMTATGTQVMLASGAGKDTTNLITSGSAALVESGAVFTALGNKLDADKVPTTSLVVKGDNAGGLSAVTATAGQVVKGDGSGITIDTAIANNSNLVPNNVIYAALADKLDVSEIPSSTAILMGDGTGGIDTATATATQVVLGDGTGKATTASIASGSTALIESGGVYTATNYPILTGISVTGSGDSRTLTYPTRNLATGATASPTAAIPNASITAAGFMPTTAMIDIYGADGTGTTDGALVDIADLQIDKADLTLIDKVVATGATFTPLGTGGDTKNIITATVNIKTGATSSSNSVVPLADTANAGLMSLTDYIALRQAVSDIETLKGASQVWLVNLTVFPPATDPLNPTDTELDDAFEDASGGTAPAPDLTQLFDPVTNLTFQWFETSSTWIKKGSAPIANFASGSPGLIVGTENSSPANDGFVYAETNGTGAVIGWSNLVTRVTNLETNKLDKSAANRDFVDTITTDIIGDTAGVGGERRINATTYNLSTGAAGTTINRVIPNATASVPGFMSAEQSGLVGLVAAYQDLITKLTNEGYYV